MPGSEIAITVIMEGHVFNNILVTKIKKAESFNSALL